MCIIITTLTIPHIFSSSFLAYKIFHSFLSFISSPFKLKTMKKKKTTTASNLKRMSGDTKHKVDDNMTTATNCLIRTNEANGWHALVLHIISYSF